MDVMKVTGVYKYFYYLVCFKNKSVLCWQSKTGVLIYVAILKCWHYKQNYQIHCYSKFILLGVDKVRERGAVYPWNGKKYRENNVIGVKSVGFIRRRRQKS